MSELARFGVSMEEGLLQQFDRYVANKGYPTRSEALRDLVKEALVKSGYHQGEGEVAGTITLIYPYGMKIKHVPVCHYASLVILANLQVHLDERTCLKVLVVRGQAEAVRSLADQLTSMKGVLGQFTLSATERIKGVW